MFVVRVASGKTNFGGKFKLSDPLVPEGTGTGDWYATCSCSVPGLCAVVHETGVQHLAVANSLCAIVHGTGVQHLAVADSLCAATTAAAAIHIRVAYV